jgi:hypothetical protein
VDLSISYFLVALLLVVVIGHWSLALAFVGRDDNPQKDSSPVLGPRDGAPTVLVLSASQQPESNPN